MYSKANTDMGVRCGRCNKLLAEVASRPWKIRCCRCGHANASAKDPAPKPCEKKARKKPAAKPKTRVPMLNLDTADALMAF